MPTVDPIILQIRAEADQATVSIKRYTDTVETGMAKTERAAQKASDTLEKETAKAAAAAEKAARKAADALEKEAARATAASQRAAERQAAADLKLQNAKEVAAVRAAAAKQVADSKAAIAAEQAAQRAVAAAERTAAREKAAADKAAKAKADAAERAAAAKERAALREIAAADRARLREAAAADIAATREVAKGLSAVRIAGIGAGQQLQDIAVQLQGGQSAGLVFAQQLPQLSFALSGLTEASGKTAQTIGKFATFLSGPWGLAIALATFALDPLISKIFSSGEAADAARPKIDRLAGAYSNLLEVMNKGGPDAITALGPAKIRLAADRAALEQAQKDLDKAEQTARRQAANTGSNSISPVPASTLRRVREAKARIIELKGLISTGEAAVSLAESRIAEKQSGTSAPGTAASTGGSAARTSSPSESQRETAALAQRIPLIRQEIQLQQMRANGMQQEADLLQARWEIERQFPNASKEQVDLAVELASQLINQKAAIDDIAAARAKMVDDLKANPLGEIDTAGLEAGIKALLQGTEAIVGPTKDAIDAANDMAEAYERVRQNAIYDLSDALASSITDAENLGETFSRVADQIIRDLARIAIQRSIIEPLTNSLGGLFGGSGSSINSFSAALGASNSAALGSGIKIPGFAGGTRFAPGGLAIVGEDGPELVNLPRGSQVIPNDALTAARSMTGVSAASASGAMNGTIRVAILMDNDVFTARVQEASVPVAVEVVRQNSPGLIQAAKAETMRDMGRPRL